MYGESSFRAHSGSAETEYVRAPKASQVPTGHCTPTRWAIGYEDLFKGTWAQDTYEVRRRPDQSGISGTRVLAGQQDQCSAWSVFSVSNRRERKIPTFGSAILYVGEIHSRIEIQKEHSF